MNTELYVEILSWHILNSNSRSAIVQGRRREGGREGEARASRTKFAVTSADVWAHVLWGPRVNGSHCTCSDCTGTSRGQVEAWRRQPEGGVRLVAGLPAGDCSGRPEIHRFRPGESPVRLGDARRGWTRRLWGSSWQKSASGGQRRLESPMAHPRLCLA